MNMNSDLKKGDYNHIIKTRHRQTWDKKLIYIYIYILRWVNKVSMLGGTVLSGKRERTGTGGLSCLNSTKTRMDSD